MLDGAILSNTRTDCSVAGTVLNNCYGLNRPDIEQQHQGYGNAANSGFQFAFGVAGDPILGIFDILTPTPLGTALVGFTVPGKHTTFGARRRRGGDRGPVGRDRGEPRLRPGEPESRPGLVRKHRRADDHRQRHVTGPRMGVRSRRRRDERGRRASTGPPSPT